MGHSIGAAYDPSVADYRATSPVRRGRGISADSIFVESALSPRLHPIHPRRRLSAHVVHGTTRGMAIAVANVTQ
jgi:hypothetical protein